MNKILSTMLVIGIIYTGTVTESMTSESPNTVSQDTTIVHNTTPLCVTRWSTWINHHNQNKNFGDYASFTPEQLQKLCPGGTIEQIECETTDSIPHNSIGPAHRCQSKKEMVCNSADTLPVECRNYTIRYYCLLGASTPVSTPSMNSAQLTPTPSPSTQPTVYNESARTSATPNADNSNLCVPGWSNYINNNHPSASNHGDKEMSAREYKMFNHSFCRHGSVTKAECWDLEIDAHHYSSGVVMTCTPEQGLVCNDADNFPIRCDDYKIRYLCDCEPSSIVSPTTGTIQATGSLTPARTIPTPMTTAKPSPGSFPAQTTPAPGTSAVTCTDGWSAWLNKDTPDTGDGDHEAMTAMEKKAFCQGGTIMDIQCATVGGVAYDHTGEIASCYTDTGFTCNNLDNDFLGQPCSDYQIRYQCKCAVALTPEGTTTTPSPALVPTEAHRPCENKTFWSPWVDKHKPDTIGGESEFMTVQEIQVFCPYGTISNIECTQQDGTDFTATGEIATCTIAEGFVCDGAANAPFPCNDYQVRYQCKEVCLVTTVPPTTASPTPKTTEAPPTTVSSTTATPTPVTTEAPPQLCTTSHWGSWINRDKPDIGGGDHEFLTPHELERFCYGGQVSKIECAVDSENNIPYYSSGEVVGYCDKERGFICNNADNFPVQCSDYKIRYFCNCTNPTDESGLTMSPTPATEALNGSATTLGTMWMPLGIGIAVGVPFSCCMICCIITICKKKSRSRKISSETENLPVAKY